VIKVGWILKLLVTIMNLRYTLTYLHISLIYLSVSWISFRNCRCVDVKFE